MPFKCRNLNKFTVVLNMWNSAFSSGPLCFFVSCVVIEWELLCLSRTEISSLLLKNFSRDWEDGSVSENTSTVQTEGFSSDLIPTCRAGQDCSQLGTGHSIARERNVCVTVTAITLMLSIPEKRLVHRANPPLYTDLEAVSRSYWQNVSTSCFGIVE